MKNCILDIIYLYYLRMQKAGHLGGDRNELPRGVKVAHSLTMGIEKNYARKSRSIRTGTDMFWRRKS